MNQKSGTSKDAADKPESTTLEASSITKPSVSFMRGGQNRAGTISVLHGGSVTANLMISRGR